MSTQARRGRTPDPPWKRRARALPVPLAVVLALALLIGGGVYWYSGDDTSDGKPGELHGETFSVGYAGSAHRLNGMTKQERTEQLRDWARFGLAARLGVDTAAYRDSSYDTLPVRDPAFDGLVREAYGPGRSLFDGRRNTLHVLVPGDDPHKKRTVAMEIDQHRTDAGSDPRRVQVHEYQLRPSAEAVRVAVGKAVRTARVRAAHGYVKGRVDTADGLKSFLGRAERLSSLQRKGSKVYAGGWSWGGKPVVRPQDVTVLGRAYASGRPPGFSLDPKNASKPADVRGALPGLSPRLARQIAEGKQPEGLARRVRDALYLGEGLSSLKKDGVPVDRAQLYALDMLLRGGAAYTQVRYEGGLAGTEAGMTLFYADYVAKHWVAGVGSGVPSKAVGGFVPDPQAAIPWGECPESLKEGAESGRLWFGANSSGFSSSGGRLDLGARTTRLFIRADSGDEEAEAGYSFGRGTRWWDRHYQDVADYEPQYERLDQLMRWSGALDWLSGSGSGGGAALPRTGESAESGLRFKSWYADHDELRERAPVRFVDPPSADGEALQNSVSKAYKQCGFRNLRGGVSLAGDAARTSPDLPQRVRRAGEFAPGAEFDASEGTGSFEQVWKNDVGEVTDRVERTFDRTEDGGALVRAEGEPREHNRLGGLKRILSKGPAREVSSQISAGGGEVRQSVEAGGRKLGGLRAARTRAGVGLWWERGLLDRFRSAALTVQERLTGGREAVPAAEDVLYGYRTEDGDRYKVGGEDAPWFSYTKGEKAADDAVVGLRLGAPAADGRGPEFSTAALVPGPGGKGPGAPRGPPDGWIEAEPAGPGGEGRPATVRPADEPRGQASKITVETSDGKKGTLVHVDGRARAKADDRVLGLNGTAAGAALMTHYPQVRAAIKAAERSGDGLYRAVGLGPAGADGIALAGAGGKIVLFEPGYDWAGRLQQSLQASTSKSGPEIRYEKGGEPQHVPKAGLKRGEGKARALDLADLLGQGTADVYASPRLAAQLTDGKGELPRLAPTRHLKVVVVPGAVEGSRSGEEREGRPDAYRYDGGYWTRIDGFDGPGGPGGGAGTGGSGAGGTGPARGPLPVRNDVLIACAQSEGDDPDSPCHAGDE